MKFLQFWYFYCFEIRHTHPYDPKNDSIRNVLLTSRSSPSDSSRRPWRNATEVKIVTDAAQASARRCWTTLCVATLTFDQRPTNGNTYRQLLELKHTYSMVPGGFTKQRMYTNRNHKYCWTGFNFVVTLHRKRSTDRVNKKVSSCQLRCDTTNRTIKLQYRIRIITIIT